MSKDAFKAVVLEAKTQSEILAKFGLQNKGHNWRTLKRRLLEEGLDTSHFQTRHIGLIEYRLGWTKPLDSILVRDSHYSRGSLKRRLLKEGLLSNSCALCNLSGTWRAKPIVMILDHINGVPNDHRLENLRMVCPNCASQLDTHAGRQRRKEPKYLKCAQCGARTKSRTRCWSCACQAQRKAVRPSLVVLQEIVSELGYVGAGRKYGVSDNAIRKWLGQKKRPVKSTRV
jgi:hypothetical protein